MKFFSLEEWSSNGMSELAAKQFREYVASIRPSLPPDAQRLHSGGGKVGIHDTRLIHLESSFNDSRLWLLLQGDVLDGDQWQPGMRSWPIVAHRTKISYTGVTSFWTKSEPDVGMASPLGYGDLGFDEFEAVGEERFEHRFLFSSGIEIGIEFSDMSFEFIPQ